MEKGQVHRKKLFRNAFFSQRGQSKFSSYVGKVLNIPYTSEMGFSSQENFVWEEESDTFKVSPMYVLTFSLK